GIRDLIVTGVQTCALPICHSRSRFTQWLIGIPLQPGIIAPSLAIDGPVQVFQGKPVPRIIEPDVMRGTHARAPLAMRSRRTCRRSEERRVGKEWRVRWSGE